MNTARLINYLAENGITLEAEGDDLYASPRSRLSDDLVAELRRRKAELLLAMRPACENHHPNATLTFDGYIHVYCSNCGDLLERPRKADDETSECHPTPSPGN